MPAGKYSLYLYHDDCRDMQARSTIERISQPLRGEFLRAASISGAVLHRIDIRLPAALASLFVGPLNAGQFSSLLSLLSGKPARTEEVGEAVYPWAAGQFAGDTERRRFNLHLNDDENTTLLTQVLDDASSRQRGTLLRELVIAGCALHELDNRFLRLLSSMPEPPATLGELEILSGKLLGLNEVTAEPKEVVAADETPTQPVDHRHVARQNMKKLF